MSPDPQGNVLTLGIDVGGTKILTTLVDEDGRIIASDRHPTDASKGAAAVVADIVDCATGCLGPQAAGAVAAGIGVAGQVEASTGMVTYAPNLGWRGFPFGAEVESALRIPTIVMNDVRAAAMGEWLHGAGRGASDVVTLFVGTGIGGAVVAAGEMLRGHGNAAGELGHLTLVVDGRDCRCPNRGCIEAYSSGWAIAERAAETAARDPLAARRLIDIAGSVDAITAAHVAQAYAEADPMAVRLIDESGRYLAAGIVGIVNAFNPARLVLGGGVVEGFPHLVDLAAATVKRDALPTPRDQVDVRRAELGGNAGAIGAAAVAHRIIA